MELNRVRLDAVAAQAQTPTSVTGASLPKQSPDTLSSNDEGDQSYCSCCCLSDFCKLLSNCYDYLTGCVRSLFAWLLGAEQAEAPAQLGDKPQLTIQIPNSTSATPKVGSPREESSQVPELLIEPVKVPHEHQAEIDQVTQFAKTWYNVDRDTLRNGKTVEEWITQFNALPAYPRSLALKVFVDMNLKTQIYQTLKKADEPITVPALIEQALRAAPANRRILVTLGQWTVNATLPQELPPLYTQGEFVGQFLLDWTGMGYYPAHDTNTEYFQRLWEKCFGLLPDGAKHVARAAVCKNVKELESAEASAIDQYIVTHIEEHSVLDALRSWAGSQEARAAYINNLNIQERKDENRS